MPWPLFVKAWFLVFCLYSFFFVLSVRTDSNVIQTSMHCNGIPADFGSSHSRRDREVQWNCWFQTRPPSVSPVPKGPMLHHPRQRLLASVRHEYISSHGRDSAELCIFQQRSPARIAGYPANSIATRRSPTPSLLGWPHSRPSDVFCLLPLLWMIRSWHCGLYPISNSLSTC